MDWAAAAIAGLMFGCMAEDASVGFDLFVPDAEVFSTDVGDGAGLYRLTPTAGMIEAPEEYEMIVDRLPNLVALRWRIMNHSPVGVGIYDYEAESATARFSMNYETVPGSRRWTGTEAQGTCEVRPAELEPVA